MIEIKVDNIKYSIGDAPIIDNVSFIGNKSKFVSVIGPSGCGKSTLLRIISGLIKPTEGSIIFEGKEIIKPIPEVSFVFQDFGLLPWLSNVDNVKLGLSFLNIS